MHTIYLCGAMHGMTYKEVQEPHDMVKNQLGAHADFEILSPLRKVPKWDGPKEIIGDLEEGRDGAEVALRDLTDVKRCTILLVTGQKAGVGSHTEVGVAWALGKIIMEVGANPGTWIHTLAHVHFKTLADAVKTLHTYWRED